MSAPPEDRLAQAGADVLRMAETGVLVVLDDAPRGFPWEHPAWALCRGLRALGFGQVCISTAGDDVDGKLSSLLPALEFEFDPGPVSYLEALRSQDTEAFGVVLHLGGSPDTRRRCARLAAQESAFASLHWSRTGVAMTSRAAAAEVDANAIVPTAARPLAPVARIAAGLALQEALISAGRLAAAAPAAPSVSYDVAGDERGPGRGPGGWKDAYVERAIIDVIGAGGVGTHLLESLVPLLGDGCELRIFDFDAVGPENLALQPAFSPEDIGRPKALAIAEKLALLGDPGLDLRPMAIRYEERPQRLARPSLRIACPDTFAARRYLNDCSLGDGVPLAEAGSSPLAAQQRVYLRGRTACLGHRIPRLAELAGQESERASCSLAHALTLPGTNMISGGILAAEALRALDPVRFGAPSRGTITYDARFPERFGVIETRPPCTHA